MNMKCLVATSLIAVQLGPADAVAVRYGETVRASYTLNGSDLQPEIFPGSHPLSLICSPLDGSTCDLKLHRSYRGMWGADWTDVEHEPTGVCFNLTHAAWMEVYSDIGFDVTRYRERYAPDQAPDTRVSVPADRAKKYPFEQVWQLNKSA